MELKMSTEENKPEVQQQQSDVQHNVDVERVVSERVAAAIAEIKGKLDAAYEKRDSANKELESYKQKEREAEIALLKEQGNLKEAHEKELETLKAENNKLLQQNLSLTRDGAIKNALTGYETRNAKAATVAQEAIASELIRDDSGVWVHRSGKSIPAFVAEFAADAENAFLFKPKANNGSGGGGNTQVVDTNAKKSLFAMSQDDVIKLVQEGKLKRK